MNELSRRLAALPRVTQDSLAKRLRDKLQALTSPDPLIVKMNGSGSRWPLICIHPSGGDVLCYAELANQLGPDQPVYTVRCRGLLEGEVPISTVEEMAAEYIESIQRIMPTGPYALAGWSMGAIVAFEMAQQLRASQEAVKILALFDMWPEATQQIEVDDCLVLTGLLGRQSGVLLDDLRRLAPQERVAFAIGEATRQGLLGVHMDIEQAKRIVQTCRINDNAASCYRAKSYPGKITLFRCIVPRDDRFGSVPKLADHTLGWSAYAQEGVDVYDVPGHHDNLMVRPQIDQLAIALKASLEAADLPSRTS